MYVGLKQPRGDGERYVTPARAAAKETKSGTDHIERAVFVTSASIFSETVGRMKLKFGEEIEKKLIY